MKKLTLFFAALLTASSMFAAGMQGAYKVGGDSPDFATLYAACDSVNKAVLAGNLTGNVELLIAGDLLAQANVGIINNTDFTITFRPDKDEPRTISFAATTDANTGPSGAFMIGLKTGNNFNWTDVVDTKNIIIDGYANVANPTNKMIITGGTGYTNGGMLVVMYGLVTKSIVRNCILNHNRTSGTCYAMCFRSHYNGYGPKGCIVENCELIAINSVGAQCVQYHGTGGNSVSTVLEYPDSCIVRNCVLRAKSRGVFFNGAKNAFVDGNKFYITGANACLADGINGTKGKGLHHITNNQFLQLSTANKYATAGYGVNGILASGGGEWEITNNLFTGFDITASGATTTRVLGIRCGNTCYVRHNTFILNALSNPTTQARTTTNPVACIYFATAEHTFENNILVLEETASNASIIRGSWESSTVGNDFYIKPADESKAILLDGATKVTNFADLTTAQQTANRNINPKFTEGYKFVAEKEIKGMKVNAIAGITLDIEGNERGDKLVYPGCFEPEEVDNIQYELNGGITNDYGWKNGEDMYQALAADVIAAKDGGMAFSFASEFGTGKKRQTFGPANVNGNEGVAFDIQTFDLTFFTTAPYAAKWGWLATYLDAVNTAAAQPAATSGQAYMRYALAAFFSNSVRATYPESGDYAVKGISTLNAYMPTWKHSYANDENPTEEFTLIDPYCGTYTFLGWYDNPGFTGEPYTTVDKGMIITLYARLVKDTPTNLEDVNEVQNSSKKVMMNGQIFIIREGHMYNMQGMLVK